MLNNIVTLKSGLEVIQDHSNWYHSKASYLPSIVTMDISLTIYEIFSVKVYSVTSKTGLAVVQGH